MKIYVSIDMEGITGLPDYKFVDSARHNYERALVNDSHSKMNNLLVEDIHPDADLITGYLKPLSMQMNFC